MPPNMRGRGRGQGAYVAPNDHEAGPSHRRTPSGSHNTDAQNLWRSFTEPARHSVSQSTSPSIPHSFGPQSENEPHNSHQSYIPLQGHQSPFDQPSPVFQGLFNPADYLDVPMGFNPLGPEDHFPGDNVMEVNEDTDPSMPPSGTPDHPIEISDGSPFVGSPYNGPDSFEERFRQHDWTFPPGYNFTEDPYWVAANYNSLNPEGTFGGPWATGQSTYGYPSYGYQQPQPPQPPQYPLPPPAPMMSPPQVQEILQGINDVRREMRHELRVGIIVGCLRRWLI
ncbi:MAPK-interacting and spindle-stabilizing protein-like [Helianthus annuus]|uniref:MAPK-interacting and spindle-stabilizing protein-like n=1 Tax=Helianthus annuus TaxID=4232 RepID=UPI001652FC01|nr:MAPK-interacting and spindle-stabilizing protein-like [Helianthus annuus]